MFIFLLLKFFSNFLSQFSQNLPILNSVKIYSKKPGGSQKIEGEAFKKQITIKVPKNKVYFVNARETHFDVLSELLFRLLDEIFSQTFS